MIIARFLWSCRKVVENSVAKQPPDIGKIVVGRMGQGPLPAEVQQGALGEDEIRRFPGRAEIGRAVADQDRPGTRSAKRPHERAFAGPAGGQTIRPGMGKGQAVALLADPRQPVGPDGEIAQAVILQHAGNDGIQPIA